MNDCRMAFQQIGQCIQALGIEAHEAAYTFGDICYFTATDGRSLSDRAATLEKATFFGNRKKSIPLFLSPARGTWILVLVYEGNVLHRRGSVLSTTRQVWGEARIRRCLRRLRSGRNEF